MTAGLTWNELDQLADYTVGALAGPEAERIAELVRTDDRWAAAHADLIAAEPLVRTSLQDVAAESLPIPDEVAARIDAALAGAATFNPTARQAGRHPVVPGRRRALRPPVLARVAAGVLALVALGGVAVAAGDLLSRSVEPMVAAEDSGAERGGDAGSVPVLAPSAPPPAAEGAEFLAGTRVIVSGTNYTLENLAELVHQPLLTDAETMSSASGELDATVDDPLAKLATADPLGQCLAAVRLVHPGEVTAVDFARFNGEPALVVWVRQGNTSTVVAVGPSCGQPGADVLGSVDVD